MKVNDVVYQNYQGIRRFGVVRQVELHGDGWTYAGVKWIDDESYDRAMSALSALRGGNHTKDAYRVDEVTVINAEKEANTLAKCLEWAAVEGQKT